MAVDEIAAQLNIDPIDFRLRNALRSGMKNTQGAIPAGALRVDEVLERSKQHPLWTRRAAQGRIRGRASGQALRRRLRVRAEDFGTGAEASFAKVEFDENGKVSLQHTAAEIGTGCRRRRPSRSRMAGPSGNGRAWP